MSHQWAYDFSAGYGRNSFDFTIGNTLNVSLGPMLPTKTQFDAGTLVLNQFVAQRRPQPGVHGRALAGPINVAFGAEFRRENYQISAGEPDSYRDGGVPNQEFGGVRRSARRCFPASVRRTR